MQHGRDDAPDPASSPGAGIARVSTSSRFADARVDAKEPSSRRSPLARIDEPASPSSPRPSHVDADADDARGIRPGSGVPAPLLEHLHVPDKEVFELKAKVNALRKAVKAAEAHRDDALRVAAAADARAKTASDRDATKLDKALTRAEAAERASDAAEHRADAADRAAAEAERRAEAAEMELRETRRVVADLRERLDEQRAVGVTLEDDVDVLRRRVRELQRGVAKNSVASQTEAEGFAAAARLADPEAAVETTDEGFRDRAAEWLRQLDAVGAETSVDAEGNVVRASARGHLVPRGLGVDLAPPPEPVLGSAGYSLAAAVAAMAAIVEGELVPAVDRAFQRQLPLRVEIRTLLEEDVAPLVAPTVARLTSVGEASVRAAPAEDDEGWGPDVDSDEEDLARRREEERANRPRNIGGTPSSASMGVEAAIMAEASLEPPRPSSRARRWAAKIFSRAPKAKKGTKTEASLLKAHKEGRLTEHIHSLLRKAKDAPTEAMRKKLREYVDDVISNAVQGGLLHADDADELHAENGTVPRRIDEEDEYDEEVEVAEDERVTFDDGFGGDPGGRRRMEYSPEDEAYLYDDYGSDYGDEVEPRAPSSPARDWRSYETDGWDGDDPSWTAGANA